MNATRILQGTLITVFALAPLGCGSDSDAPSSGQASSQQGYEIGDEADHPEAVRIPAGATLVVSIDAPLDSGDAEIGDRFGARLERPYDGGSAVLPAGTPVHGVITDLGTGDETSMTLDFDGIEVDRKIHPLSVEEIEIVAQPDGAANAAKILGGGAAGAIIGAVVDGGEGAAIGGVAGVTAGTIAVIVQGEEVEIPEGQRIALRLDAPAEVTPAS